MATGHNPLGASAYSSTPKPDLDLGTVAFVKPPPAIIQAAKDWRYYETQLLSIEKRCGELFKEYKESGAWKEHYKTWADACEPLHLSRRQVDRLIAEEIASITEMGHECPKVVAEQKKQTLKAIAALPDPPKEEEPEKPQVRTADEVIAANAEQDGRPKDEALGWPIPQGCLDLWNKREEVQPMMTCASKLKCFLEDMVNQPLRGGLWAPLDGQVKTFFEGANRLYAYLEDCKPYAVCPNCDGTKRDAGKPCPICNARGLVSRSMWTRNWSCMGFSDAEKESFITKRQKNLKN